MDCLLPKTGGSANQHVLTPPLCYDDKVIDKIPRDYADNKNFPKELITDMEENIKLLYTRFKN